MTGRMFKTCVVGLAVGGVLTLTALDAQAVITHRTVALTGEAAPGTEPGVVYSRFDTLLLNAVGQTAFLADLTGSGVDSNNNGGVWSESGGSLRQIAREGETAPGTGPGVVYSRFLSLVFNGTGQTAFNGDLTGAGVDSTNNSGLWSEGSGSLTLTAREGEAAPGTGPGVVFFGGFGPPVLNVAGQTAFNSDLTGSGVDTTNNSGLWSEGSGSLTLAAREGEAAPDTEPGVVFFGGFPTPVLNGAGQIAFRGNLTGSGVDITNNLGIWSGDSGSLGLVAREGEAAPDPVAGTVYNLLNFPVINDAGEIVFSGTISDTTESIWSQSGDSLRLVVLENDFVSLPLAEEFNRFNSPVVNGSGQIAFWSELDGPLVDFTNDGSIWLESGGSLTLIAREGESAPGTGPGVMFSAFRLGSPVLNGAGQTAFSGDLAGQGVDATNNSGIWATDPTGVLNLIAREGDLFDVNDDPLIDDFRTIGFVDLVTGSGGEDGRGTSFNDAGQLAFRLEFTDGSEGIFVATVPEPGTLGVLALGVLWGVKRRKLGS